MSMQRFAGRETGSVISNYHTAVDVTVLLQMLTTALNDDDCCFSKLLIYHRLAVSACVTKFLCFSYRLVSLIALQ
jgi:hypothetical protein